MVKLTGPAFAAGASGSLADQLTFAQSMGRHYVKRKPKPKQPNSPPQIAMRAIMAFIANQWQSISAAGQASWMEPAEKDGLSSFNAYQRYNLARWRKHKAPTQAWPANEVLLYANITNWATPGGVRHARPWVTHAIQRDGWAAVVHKLTGLGDFRAWNNLVRIFPTPTPGTWDTIISHLEPGTHYFSTTVISTDGNMMAYHSVNTAIVTDE